MRSEFVGGICPLPQLGGNTAVMTGQDSSAGEETGAMDGRAVAADGRARRRRRAVGGALLLMLLAGAFFGGFAWFGHHVSRMITPADPAAADAIIVLTGGHFRLNAAVDLLKSGKGERLLISGVNPIASRADLLEASGGDPAIFECCVDIDHAALDTVGNAEESAKWLRRHAYKSAILVTNNYHMPRSLLEMRRLLKDAELQPYPVVNSRLDNGEWMTRPDALRVLFTEYTKFLAALVRSWVPVSGEQAPELAKAGAGGSGR